MILDRTVEFYSRTESFPPGCEGIPKFTYQMMLSTRASVQPAKLSSSELALWGLTTLGADVKKVFVPGEIQDCQAWLIKDLKTNLRYEIRGSNPWPRHTEYICLPYQGGDPI